MKVAIVQIGNSRGVRLPKAVLDQVALQDEAKLTVEDGRIVIAPPSPRRGWAEAMAADPPGDLDADDLEWLDAPMFAR
jgi:antitoxin MazE